MPGGEMQLSAYGAENHFLNGNPQLTFFRTVYRRHTPFAMETIRVNLNGPVKLSADTNVKLQTRIHRNGDLVSQIYLVFELPDIYSGYNPVTAASEHAAVARHAAHRFQWIRALGCHIVDHVQLQIGPTLVSELWGQWIQIWHELFAPFDRDAFNEMVGNVPELFDPAAAPGSDGMYPTSTLKPELNDTQFLPSASPALQNPYHRPPSIRGRTITVPLPFYFAANPGLSLPLICLQYHPVQLHVELRPLRDLYTLIETDEADPHFGQRIRPTHRPEHALVNFLAARETNAATGDIDLSYGDVARMDTVWQLDAHLDVNYIFLGQLERDKFAAVSHEYTIQQVRRHEFVGVVGERTLELRMQHPVQTIVWVAVKDAHIEANNFGNYTNWHDPDLSPGSLGYVQKYHDELDPYTGADNVPALAAAGVIATKYNFRYYERDIIQQVSLLFNGVERFKARDHAFFATVQRYQHKLRGGGGGAGGASSGVTCASRSVAPHLPGVMSYSFALEPSKSQPSGACNMSRIKRVQLRLKTVPVPLAATSSGSGDSQHRHKYNVYVYTIHLNLLRILAGMGGLAFQS